MHFELLLPLFSWLAAAAPQEGSRQDVAQGKRYIAPPLLVTTDGQVLSSAESEAKVVAEGGESTPAKTPSEGPAQGPSKRDGEDLYFVEDDSREGVETENHLEKRADGRQYDLGGLKFPLRLQTLFHKAMLEQHNSYRHRHSAAPLVWNSGLAIAAYKRASSGKFSHTPNNPWGENLAMGSYSNPLFYAFAWYDEERKYDFKKSQYSSATGHFTQMVWKGTKEVGCAMVNNNRIAGFPYYLACEYKPAGNYIGEFRTNVIKYNRDPYPVKPPGSI